MDEATKKYRQKTIDKLQADLARYELDREENDQMADHMYALLPKVI